MSTCNIVAGAALLRSNSSDRGVRFHNNVSCNEASMIASLEMGAYRLRAHVMFAVGTGLLLFSIGTVPSMARSNNKEGQSGVASVYSTSSGSRTSTGARLNPGALTAAHRSLPFGTKVRVTNKINGRSVVVIINDRGPFVHRRVIDLTPAAAHALGFSGLAPVNLHVTL